MNGPQRTACLAKGYTNNWYTIFKMNRLYIPVGRTEFSASIRGSCCCRRWVFAEQQAPSLAKCWILGRPRPILRGGGDQNANKDEKAQLDQHSN